jgi:hypothetical protein
LEWLATGETGDRAEFDKGLARTSVVEDHKHFLWCINRAFADEVRWRGPDERRELCSSYYGIFKNVVGIIDCTEHFIEKPKNPSKERQTYSGKAGTNTMKTLACINKRGEFIYVSNLMEGRENDRNQWTCSPLYMDAGNFFSTIDGEMELVATDGGFKGYGPHLISFDTLGTEEKKTFNLAFKEVRVGIENAFGRVQMWFPLLGVEKAY